MCVFMRSMFESIECLVWGSWSRIEGGYDCKGAAGSRQAELLYTHRTPHKHTAGRQRTGSRYAINLLQDWDDDKLAWACLCSSGSVDNAYALNRLQPGRMRGETEVVGCRWLCCRV